METVAAERLNKIGQDPQMVSTTGDVEADINLVNEIIMQATPRPSSDSEQSEAGSTAQQACRRRRKLKALATRRRNLSRGDVNVSSTGGGGDGNKLSVITSIRKCRSACAIVSPDSSQHRDMLWPNIHPNASDCPLPEGFSRPWSEHRLSWWRTAAGSRYNAFICYASPPNRSPITAIVLLKRTCYRPTQPDVSQISTAQSRSLNAACLHQQLSCLRGNVTVWSVPLLYWRVRVWSVGEGDGAPINSLTAEAWQRPSLSGSYQSLEGRLTFV